MKITICAYDAPNNIDGPSAWIKRLLPFLRTKGIESRIIFFAAHDNDLPTYNYFINLGFKCKIIYWELFAEDKILSLLEDVKTHPPDIFVANYFSIACLASKWIKEAGIPTIMVLHNDDEGHQSLVKEYAAEKDYISAIVSVSNLITSVAKLTASMHPCIKTIPCGAPISKNIIQFPANGQLKIVYAGRIEEKQKQISLLTKAFCKAARDVPNTEFAIFGSGSAERNVKRILETMGQGLPVKFFGKLDSNQVLEKFSSFHIFVLLSDYEGLPISLMESMGAGLVPVCTNIRSGVSELIDDGKNGILIDNRDDAFINAIRFLKENSGTFHTMSLAARKKIEFEYSQEVCNNLWIDLFYELTIETNKNESVIFPSIKELKYHFNQNYYESINNLRPAKVAIPLYKLKTLLGRMKRRVFK